MSMKRLVVVEADTSTTTPLSLTDNLLTIGTGTTNPTYGTLAASTISSTGDVDAAVNVGVGGALTADSGGMAGGLVLATVGTAPASDVASGKIAIWFDGSALKVKIGSTVSTITLTP